MIMALPALPKVNIVLGTYDNITIKQEHYTYILCEGQTEWHRYSAITHREIYEQWSSYDLAHGDILLVGLGFGHQAVWLASKPSVNSVTVIEKYQGVIDSFVSNNKLLDNMKIICADIDTYTTTDYYDCFFVDHIASGGKSIDYYKNLAHLANQIPNHKLFWFWSLEFIYLTHYYDMSIEHLYMYPILFDHIDVDSQWSSFICDLSINTLPRKAPINLKDYINVYFLRHLIAV